MTWCGSYFHISSQSEEISEYMNRDLWSKKFIEESFNTGDKPLLPTIRKLYVNYAIFKYKNKIDKE